MSLRLENLVKPFTSMTADEQFALIRQVRYNRFVLQPSKVKTATQQKAKRKTARVKTVSKEKAKSAMSAMSAEEKRALLTSMLEQSGD